MTAPEQRLLSLAAFLLKQEEPVAWSRLREEFRDFYAGSAQAAEKKWTRDKSHLLEAGIPIEFIPGQLGADGGYVIRPEAFHLRDLALSPEEAAVLWTAGSAAARMHDHPWRGHVAMACEKLRSACRALPSVSTGLHVRHAGRPDRGHQRALVEQIGEALRRRKRVRLEYQGASRGQMTTREVDLYGFAWRRGIWLFAGHCHVRGELRVFYLDNVRALVVNDRRPAERDYEIPADFDITTFSRQQPWEYWTHPPTRAEVRVRGALAPLSLELFPGARSEPAPEAGALVTLEGVRNLPALVRAVLALGPDAELVSPPEGRELARQMLAPLAARLAAPTDRGAA